MKKIRVYELARELGRESRDLVEQIRAIGISVSGHQSMLSDCQCDQIRDKLNPSKKEDERKRVVIRRRKKKEVVPEDAVLATEGEGAAVGESQEGGGPEVASVSAQQEGGAVAASVAEQDSSEVSDLQKDGAAGEASLSASHQLQEGQEDHHQGPDQKDEDSAAEGAAGTVGKKRFSRAAQSLVQKRSLQGPRPEKDNTEDVAAVARRKARGPGGGTDDSSSAGESSSPFLRTGKETRTGGPRNEEEALRPRGIVKKEKRSQFTARQLMMNLDEDEGSAAPTTYRAPRKKTVYAPVGTRSRDQRRRRDFKKTQITTPKASLRVIQMDDTTMSVGELARQLSMKVGDLIKHLMKEGVMATVNERLDSDVIQLLAHNFGFDVKMGFKTADEILARSMPSEESLESRPPIVTLMGHVDHGKTSILDAVRSSAVGADEHGGITQHIGAYVVPYEDKSITFLDTPGHAAFSNMRIRGAKVTDIVILVVAADDGVMPQTEEAISHAKDAEVPVIVAINKIDRATQNLDRIYSELAERGIQSEEWGGDHQFVKISALQKTGLDDLLAAVVLQAELLELKASREVEARGVIIEAHLDVGRGPVATIMVSEGVFRKGDQVVAGVSSGRIRAMVNDQGHRVSEAEPSTPVEIVGFNELPVVGDIVDAVKDYNTMRAVITRRKDEAVRKAMGTSTTTTLQDLIARVDAQKILAVPFIIKADTQGSLQAICEALADIKSDKVKAKIVHKGVGGINASDVALAQTSGAVIFGFNVRAMGSLFEALEKQGVVVNYFGVIYELIDAAESLMAGSLPPIRNEVVIGRADVRKSINVSKVGCVAGSAVVDGHITRHCMLRLIRDDVVVYTGKIGSLRRFKDDVQEVGTGYECGISIENCKDIRIGDVIEAFKVEEEEATL